MKTVGIIAEYNPFHTGHARHITQTRRRLGEDCRVVCVMSGNWVQRGECAVTDKWTRAGMALAGGADLVLELPTVWAVSPAETFAREAALLLEATGVVTHLSFGSECGDVDALQRLAVCLDSPRYPDRLRQYLDQGLPFAACRQAAAEDLLRPGLAGLLAQPNNNLGVEYIRALKDMKSEIQPVTFPRRGADHDGETAGEFASASLLRRWLRAGETDRADPFLPASWEGESADLKWCERGVLSRLRSMRLADWSALPDSGAAEGLPRRLARAAEQAADLEEFYTLVKTRRYAHARIRRLALWAFLGLTAADRPEAPPYLRVLGLNGRGREVLREMKGRAFLPILTKPAHGRGIPLLELEGRLTALYGLCFPTPRPGTLEWTRGPVVLETKKY